MLFDEPSLADHLYANSGRNLDELPFGVVGINDENEVIEYNLAEEAIAGLSRENVFGKDFFFEVAPCMNNFMVAERFNEEEEIDDIIDYLLTLKVKPTKVALRLIKRPDQNTRFVLVKRLVT